VIKTEFNPSCIANFEMIAGDCAFEQTFESDQAFVSTRNTVTNPITGAQQFYRLSQ
jgi:hypothetical protein